MNVADFYLRAVAEKRHRTVVAAVCYQRIENGRPADRMNILLSEEFGEKEILRKVKALGLFDTGASFSPIGPDVRGDLSLLAARATHLGIVDLKGDALRRFLEEKAARVGPHSEVPPERPVKKVEVRLTEKASELVERLALEAELFLKGQAKESLLNR